MNYSDKNLQFQLAMDADCSLNGLRSWEKQHHPMQVTYEEESGLAFIAAHLPLETRSVKVFTCIVSLN